ncbi:MAG: carbon-nitrogen hydrolase family protein [Planctomycetes bacterium]|nr:carbon-nitrogen hydrolase family protein [Planctomycetota bacterium]
MKAALATFLVLADRAANLAAMMKMTNEAADDGADLILFPEAAATGLVNDDHPEHDLPLGEAIPGSITNRLAAVARRRSIYLGTGILEREGNCLYDSAVLLDPNGDLVLKYRRIQPQWHGRDANPEVYRQGDELGSASTTFGNVAFLICGDLWDDSIVARLREIAPDYVLFPFSRNFGDGSFDQERWDREEESDYAAKAALLGATTFMVNGLEDRSLTEYPSFGGALAVSAEGKPLCRWPLGAPGILYAEV